MNALYIGSATVDVNASCSALKPRGVTHHRHTEKCVFLSFASKTILDDVYVTTGGSAANSAVASSVLGTSVELVSAVGGDVLGELVLADLKKHGVQTKHVWRINKAKTSVGINLLCKEGEKTNLVYKGATDWLGPEHLHDVWVRASDAVVCTSLASKKNWGLFQKALLLARQLNKKTVFAPSITMLRVRKQELEKMRDEFDVVVMNFEEAGFFMHCHNPIESINALPGKINVVTHDVHGTYVAEGGSVWHVPTLKVNVRDTTGAGDSFTGALVHGLLHHQSALEAVKLATAIACWNIQQEGAKVRGSRKQILRFFEKNRGIIKESQLC